MPVDADPSASTADRRARSSRWQLRVAALAAVIILVDQVTKLWATSALSDDRSIALIGDLLGFRLTYNPGAAFSIGTGMTWVFTVIAAAAVVGITWTARRVRSRAWAAGLGLLLGGATTHLLDRLFREPGFARGHVVDFIDYAGLFIGNVADISLVAGGLLLVVLSVRGTGMDGRRTARQNS